MDYYSCGRSQALRKEPGRAANFRSLDDGTPSLNDTYQYDDKCQYQ